MLELEFFFTAYIVLALAFIYNQLQIILFRRFDLFENMNGEEFEQFITLCWAIWGARNKWIMRRDLQPWTSNQVRCKDLVWSPGSKQQGEYSKWKQPCLSSNQVESSEKKLGED